MNKACLTMLLAGASFWTNVQDARGVRAASVVPDDTVRISFRVNESAVDTSYADNGRQMSRLDSLLGAGRIDSVVILSAASPDGRPAVNRALAQRRAEAVESSLMAILGGGKNI